jgi:hypothetical protein
VMDWGVAAVAGTPAFRAPDATLDERSDVYALGRLLEVLAAPDTPAALTAVVAKATCDDAAARYAGADELLLDLGRFEEGQAVEAWREPLWHRTRRFASRNAVLIWLLVAFAVVKSVLYFSRGR